MEYTYFSVIEFPQYLLIMNTILIKYYSIVDIAEEFSINKYGQNLTKHEKLVCLHHQKIWPRQIFVAFFPYFHQFILSLAFSTILKPWLCLDKYLEIFTDIIKSDPREATSSFMSVYIHLFSGWKLVNHAYHKNTIWTTDQN